MIEEGADSTPRAFRSELVPRKGTRIPIDVHARVLVGDGQVVGVTSTIDRCAGCATLAARIKETITGKKESDDWTV